jgi:hypothetical protein
VVGIRVRESVLFGRSFFVSVFFPWFSRIAEDVFLTAEIQEKFRQGREEIRKQ